MTNNRTIYQPSVTTQIWVALSVASTFTTTTTVYILHTILFFFLKTPQISNMTG
jgi:hypothetical protein